MALYLGLDCGGSSCRALVLDDDLEPVFLAQGGSANLASTPEHVLDRSLQRALEGLPSVDYVCACFAGLISASRLAQAEAILRPLIGTARLWLEPDYVAALWAAPPGTDVCVIAGTGSVVCSWVEGRVERSGGGGYLLGDEGSGFDYGRAALRHFLAAPLVASPSLRHAVSMTFRCDEPEEVRATLYGAAAPAAMLASLATAFGQDALAGEPYAVTHLTSQSRILAEIVVSHLDRWHPERSEAQIALTGGLWKRAVFRDAFAGALEALRPGLRVVKSAQPPVRGAALLARDRALKEAA